MFDELEKNNLIDFESFLKKLICPNMFATGKIKELQKGSDNELESYSIEKIASCNNQDEIIKRTNYVNLLTKIQNIILFLIDNLDKFEYKNNSYYVNDQEVYKLLTHINNKYNLELNIIPKFKMTEDKGDLPILVYYEIDNKTWNDYSLFVRPNEFKEQMQYLKDNGYTPIFFSELSNLKNINKPVIIVFEDGYKGVYENAFHILKQFGFKANLFLITAWIGGDVYLTKNMIRELIDSKLMEIGSHSMTHQDLTKLSLEELDTELQQSFETIYDFSKQDNQAFCYPNGKYNDDVLSAVKRYYKCALTTDEGKNDSNCLNDYTLKRQYVYRNYNLEKFKSLL